MQEMDLEALYDLTLPRQVALSPDGERCAFVAQENDEADDRSRSSLFVVPTDGSRPPHRLTRASTASQPTWSPDGERLGFVAARERDSALRVGPEDDGGDDTDPEEKEAAPSGGADDDGPKPQVWTFDLALGGDARQVTQFDEGVREFDWGPDGERIVVSARDPTDDEREYLDQVRDDGPIEVTRLQHKRDGAGWLDDVTTYLFVVDVESRETERLDEAYGAGTFEPVGGLHPSWGPTDRIAFVTNRTDHPDDSAVVDVYTVAPDGTDLNRVTDGEHYAAVPTWSPDGEQLAYGARNPPMNWYKPQDVHVADLDSGATHVATEGFDRSVVPMAGLSWSDDETVTALAQDEARFRPVRIDADGSGVERAFATLGDDRTVDTLDAVPDSDTAVAIVSGASDGLDVCALDALEEERRLTDLNADFLAAYDQPSVERLTVENGDGEAIEALAFVPPTLDPDSPVEHPVVVQIHGGPMACDTPGWQFKRSYFANQGYVVLCVNYRGSTSYGRAFAESLRGSRGDLESDDVISGVEHLVDLGWADPDRLFCTGFSYGGITSAHVAVRDNPFAAIAPEHGIYDFYSNYGTDDNHLWHDDEFGVPWENEETYRDISSISRVDEVDTPMLVTAGEHDWRCPPTQAEQLYVSVRKQGVDAKLVVYQNEHHNVGAPERAIHRLRELENWFREHDPTVDES
ncbi:S9 family peptidase [Halomarina rubra]|uniref:S9 family peptidase n=1 Tax=Halomarina rubra TaxID=2071873 RepID=A0ABD6B0Z5_9EURY|nr:S9 family peptidase [Halomarina rubra]